MKRKDIPIGARFGRLVTLGDAPKRGTVRMTRCRCDCGKETIVENIHLRSGHTKSCGCLALDKSRKQGEMRRLASRHEWKHPLYTVWQDMKQRCLNPASQQYPNYGGRGIKICREWMEDFLAFKHWAISCGYAKGLSIDRIDVNGNYEPSNCRFSDSKVQGRNRRCNIMLEHDGVKATAAEWAERLKIPYTTILERWRKGWSIAKIIKTPKRAYVKRR